MSQQNDTYDPDDGVSARLSKLSRLAARGHDPVYLLVVLEPGGPRVDLSERASLEDLETILLAATVEIQEREALALAETLP